MPAGRPRMYSGPLQPGKRSAAVPRTGNSAVRRAYKKFVSVPKSKTGVNKNAIVTLSRQVRSLQLSQHGRIQSKIQVFQKPTQARDDWHTINLWKGDPMAFALNDFTQQASVYQVHGPKSTDTTTDNIYNHKTWEQFDGLGEQGNINERGGPDKAMSYWKTSQDNLASTENYLPISSTIHFEFNRSMLPASEIECVRIDIVRAKNIVPMNKFNMLQLPTGLMGMRNLAGKEMLQRNRINRKYFDVVKTKYLYFKPRVTEHNSDDVTIRKQWKWTQNFPKKPIILDLNANRAEDVHGQGVTTTTTNADGTTTTTTSYTGVADVQGEKASFADVMQPSKIYWAVISFSNPSETDSKWNMTMMRTNKWRDNDGTD